MKKTFWSKLANPKVGRIINLFFIFALLFISIFGNSNRYVLSLLLLSIGIFFLSIYFVANIKAKISLHSDKTLSWKIKLFGSPMFSLILSVAIFGNGYFSLIVNTGHWMLELIFQIVIISLLFWQDKVAQKVCNSNKSLFPNLISFDL